MGFELKIQRISGNVKQLDCGNDAVNKKLNDAYYADLLRQGYTYEVSVGSIILGYYMLTFRKYMVTEWSSDEIGSYIFGLSTDFFSLHLQYIMIDKNYQEKGIGTVVLKHIISNAKELSSELPIRFLTLDAVSDKYKWYEERGFLPINDEDVDKGSLEIRMYLDCMDDKSELEQYISSII